MDNPTKNESGEDEHFGKCQTVCINDIDQTKAQEEDIAELTREKSKRNHLLVAVGATVWANGMNCLCSRFDLETVNADDEMKITHKVLCHSYEESKRTMKKVLEALGKGEKRRIKLLQRYANYKCKELEIEKRRPSMERVYRLKEHELALQSVQIEEHRVRNNKTPENKQQKRRINLNI